MTEKLKAVERPFGYLIDSTHRRVEWVPKGTRLDDRAGNSTLVAKVFGNGDTLCVKTGAGARPNLPSFRYESVGLFPGDGLIEGEGDEPKTPLEEVQEKVGFVS